ncbi:hypothetical protein F0562_003491 [Nyssa sinensis]|uniref:Retrotransposon Copia-like N-terminal domain-containing protein n=1 Tax=Nyssa sinensis TaxID=561372 RepID=A0A5J5BZJ2_9ASTE|nr:hypothetical protein F0562_003491 [Nyssa sinensis]
MATKEEKFDDLTHHLYIHPSDHPGLVLVSHPLSEDNHASWSQAILLALEAKNKLGSLMVLFLHRHLPPLRKPDNGSDGLWDELSEIQSPHHCTCGPCTCEARKENLAQLKSDLVITFLMRLNDSYVANRGHILLMEPLPNVSRAYALIMQEERHRSISS